MAESEIGTEFSVDAVEEPYRRQTSLIEISMISMHAVGSSLRAGLRLASCGQHDVDVVEGILLNNSFNSTGSAAGINFSFTA